MSVTFGCNEAHREFKMVPCDSPSLGLTCEPGNRCGYCDDGMMREKMTKCPEVNFANTNARNILALLNLPTEEWGSLSSEDIPTVLQRCMVVLAKPTTRDHLIRDPWEGRGHEPHIVNGEDGLAHISTGPRVIVCGNTDERTVQRVTALRNLLVWAHERNFDVQWG